MSIEKDGPARSSRRETVRLRPFDCRRLAINGGTASHVDVTPFPSCQQFVGRRGQRTNVAFFLRGVDPYFTYQSTPGSCTIINT
jgi:hypothetical protein